jgi:acetyltransferase-like isoleucine patch superfamily enzyme
MSFYIHPTAEVSNKATIGNNTRIWHQAQVREGARIGSECIIGKGAYVDFDVTIGDRCKLQNGVYVYHGAILAEGVFLGPGAMVLNDKNPRAINPDGTLKTEADWNVSPVRIGRGAGIGGGAMILPGVTLGAWAMVGTGAVVTRDVPDYGLCLGNPARLVGFVCPCGQRLTFKTETPAGVIMVCLHCSDAASPGGSTAEVDIPLEVYRQVR